MKEPNTLHTAFKKAQWNVAMHQNGVADVFALDVAKCRLAKIFKRCIDE